MSLTARWWVCWLAVLGLPMAVFALLLIEPGLDRRAGSTGFHFYVVSGTALAAAVACGLIVGITRSLRETRLIFLGLAFLGIAAIFSVHGLGTAGHLHEHAYNAARVSSWLSVFAGAFFVAASVAQQPPAVEDWLKRNGGLLVGCVVFAVGLYIGLSVFIADEWLDWVPIRSRTLQLVATVVTLTLLVFSTWRYFQAFLFARLPSQWAMVCLMVLLFEVQVCLTWGRYWSYSWWLYHGLYAVAFVVLFASWFIEARRAGSLRVIAEGLSMRDAIAQLNQGYSRPISDLVDAIEWKDLYTLGHVRRVASYALMIGNEFGLSVVDLRALALGAQMHDVGKIGVPDKILTKPGPLTPEEFAIIQRHVPAGFEIATKVKALEPALDGIRYHHERFDGTGYPHGLQGDAIPLQARIVAVADAYDAMTSGRVYQPAVTQDAAKAELLRVSGTHFDPACVEAFVHALAKVAPSEEAHSPAAFTRLQSTA